MQEMLLDGQSGAAYHSAQGSTVPETATEEPVPGEFFPTTSLDRKLERKESCFIEVQI